MVDIDAFWDAIESGEHLEKVLRTGKDHVMGLLTRPGARCAPTLACRNAPRTTHSPTREPGTPSN